MDHPRADDGPDRKALLDMYGEGCESCRTAGFSAPPMDVDSAMSYLAQSCPDCGGLYIWDDLGRFHHATGEEGCPDPGSLQVRVAGELEEVPNPPPLGRCHGESEDGVPVMPHDLLGFRARRELAGDRPAREEN